MKSVFFATEVVNFPTQLSAEGGNVSSFFNEKLIEKSSAQRAEKIKIAKNCKNTIHSRDLGMIFCARSAPENLSTQQKPKEKHCTVRHHLDTEDLQIIKTEPIEILGFGRSYRRFS